MRDNYYRLAAIDDLKALADQVERLEAVAELASYVHELWLYNHYREESEDANEAMHELGEALEKAGFEAALGRMLREADGDN